MTLALGSEFDGYRIDAVLGRGGMGAVYEAMHLRLQRVVAVKVLDAGLERDQGFRERFRREQRLASAIDHPNIVPIYDAGEYAGQLYIAMRLVDGGTLADVISSGDRDTGRALGFMRQAGAALDAAHELGLVHRDVKPHNMLVDSRGHLYLTDFGIAIAGPDRLTATGQFVGTVAYVAPEQIDGQAVTPAADIYALGCVLYEVLTGSAPFRRESAARILFAHLNDEPPRVTELRPDLAPGVNSVIARAMAKAPADRYPSAGAFVSAAMTAAGASELVIREHGARPAAGRRHPGPPPRRTPAAAGRTTFAPARPKSSGAHTPSWLGRQRRSSRDWLRRLLRLTTAEAPSKRDERGISDSASEAASALRPTLMREGEDRRTRAASDTRPARATSATPGHPRFLLNPGFQYIHEPLVDDRSGLPLLGNGDLVDLLKERIVHSRGGAFLVTGFRGVGKTTVIARALAELETEHDDVAVLAVRVNVARPRTVEELLFEIIRRVFETLKDENLLRLMSPTVQRELLLAYARTSLSFNETRAKAANRGITVGLPSVINALAPKIDASRTRTDSLATQAAFLAYSDADVEHDFLRIISLVERGEAVNSPVQRYLPWRRTPTLPGWRGKIVVVIDELDKLTTDDEGMRCVSDLIAGLKNLLTARGVHFLFVAGPDLHDVALAESRRGNSVYDSVFSWQFYVPCIWDATDALLDAILDDADAGSPAVDVLRQYLRFKSRGVARLLLMELNAFVRWADGSAYLEVRSIDRARVQFYADLETIIRAFVDQSTAEQAGGLAVDEDRWKLGAYYVTDWILRSRGTPFTADELVGADEKLALHPAFTLSRGRVREFLLHLVDHDLLRLAPAHAPDRTYQGDVPGGEDDVFELAADYRVKLAAFARYNERERVDLGGQGSPAPKADARVGTEVRDGRYELIEVLNRGGRARVFRARDRQTSKDCAIKVYQPLPSPHLARARIERAAHIAAGISHENIASTLDIFDEEGQLVIATTLAAGTALSQLLAHAVMTPGEAVAIARQLTSALAHVHELGVARLDLKPSRIVLSDDLKPVIVDLGLAKVVGAAATDGRKITARGAVLGTPAYAAPEQLRGEDADIRSDIYTVGLIIHEMIGGKRARQGGFAAVMAQEEAHVDVQRLDVSEALRTAITRALAYRADDRFQTPSAMAEALARTSEARIAAGGPD